MCSRIPGKVLLLCAEMVAKRETHATLDSLFTYAGAPGEPPGGSKLARASAWLRRTNNDESVDPLRVLGQIIESYMEESLDPGEKWNKEKIDERDRLHQALADSGLHYVKGGKVVGAVATPSRALEDFIRDRDLASIDAEFERALENVESKPRDAVSAASNILESVCKTLIEEEGLRMPPKRDLQPVWSGARRSSGFPSSASATKVYPKSTLDQFPYSPNNYASLRKHREFS